MPTAGRPKLTVRLDEAVIKRFQAACHNAGANAPTVVERFILWYLGEEEEPPSRPVR